MQSIRDFEDDDKKYDHVDVDPVDFTNVESEMFQIDATATSK